MTSFWASQFANRLNAARRAGFRRSSPDRLRRRLVALSLLGLLSVAGTGALLPMPGVRAETTTSAVRTAELVPDIVEVRLPTGQNLYIKEDHSRPIVTIDTWVKTGSVNETAANNGVSHFLEHLLFKGTARYGPGVIDRRLEARGAEFNAATSDDFTHYYITTAPAYFEEALALHADMLTQAAIPPKELPQERKVVQEEINRADDNPSRQLYVELSRRMYGSHGYGLDTLGPKENIARMPREDILAYYHYWYQPKNFNTIIVGDIDPERVKRLVAKTFQAPRFQPSARYQPPLVGAVEPPDGPQSVVLENPNVNQAYLALAMPGPSQQKPDEVYALDLAMLALGSGKSSRLYRALRENQPLVNAVSAGNYTQKATGLVVINAEAKPENREAVKREILRQLEDLRANGITSDELAKAKTQYIKDFVFENETTDGTASAIGYNVTIGSLTDYREHVNRVESVTPERIRTALNAYLDPRRAVLAELLPAEQPSNAPKRNIQAESEANLALLQASAARMTEHSRSGAVGVAPSVPTSAQAGNGTTGNASGANESVPVKAAENDAVTRTVLPNGMTFIAKPLKDSATLALKIFVKGGAGVETGPGTASLVAATLMQGSRGRDAGQISRELESKGMALSFSAGEDAIEATGTAIADDWGELAAILQDVLTTPRFEEREIAKKKEQLRQAILAGRDNPSAVAFENLDLDLYPSHPYGNEGKRVEAALDTITRQDVLDYYRRWFTPQNMVVSLVGRFDPQTAANFLSGLYPACDHCGPNLARIAPVPALAAGRTIVEEKPRLSAVWMAQGWLAPSIHDSRDYAALKVLNSLVGSGMSSRLFVDLREKQGLAYVVGSQYPSREQQSRFVMYIGTDPVNTEQVRQGFDREIIRLQRQPVFPTELAEAKSKLIGGFALAHDTNASQAYYLGLYETLGVGYGFDDTYPALINQVTPADVQRVARQYFSAPSVLSLVRPAADAKK